jgi:carbamoyltransferase
MSHSVAEMIAAVPAPGPDVSVALGTEALDLFARQGGSVAPLRELFDTHAQLWELEDFARSRQAAAEQVAQAKRAVDRLNAARHRLIDDLDRSLLQRGRPTAAPPVPHSETPGELCDRLCVIALKLEHAREAAVDASILADARRLCVEKLAGLGAWQAHLQACLRGLLADLAEGRAVCAPRTELKMYNHPALNPVLRREAGPVAPLRRFPRFPARNVVGLACTGHGASLAFLDEDGTMRASVLDRWAGTKHSLMLSADEERDIVLADRRSPIDASIYGLLQDAYGGFPPYRVFERTFPAWLAWLLRGLAVGPADIEMVVVSPSYFATTAARLGPHLHRWLPRARVVAMPEHHEVHQRQAFWQSGLDEAAVLTLDTCGESLDRFGGKALAGTISVMNVAGEQRTVREFFFPEHSAGLLYAAVTRHVGFRQGQEGKTMGLAPYGRPVLFEALERHLVLREDGSFGFLPLDRFRQVLADYVPPRPLTGGAALLPEHEDVAYAGQALVERIVVNAWRAALLATGQRNLVYAGGLTLNSVANELAYRATRPERFYLAPNASDTGQALGCALLGAYEVAGWRPRRTELPEFLGPAYTDDEIAAVARSSPAHVARALPYEETVARCIANGHIVARFAGRAEYGPRALGNRSILCDPRRPDMKDYLNARVKHREAFRPFAPAVLEEEAAAWFDVDGRSSYMLRVVPVRSAARARIPAIVHVDGTARLQTVGRENPAYRRIIEAFLRLTGVPVILNTSFNLAGKPIVETPEHALECFLSTDIDVLFLGEWALSKRPLASYLETERA